MLGTRTSMQSPADPNALRYDFAAGGLVERRVGNRVEIAIVARHRYGSDGRGDHALPKGHLEPNESWPQAALREVEEETGCRCEIVGPPSPVAYMAAGVPKLVVFFPMRCLAEGGIQDTAEVREVEWLTPAAALSRASYPVERDLIRSTYFPSRTGASVAATGRGRRVPGRRAALVLLAIVAIVALLEGSARLAAHWTERARGLTLDPDLGWRPIPNIAKRGAYWGQSRVAHSNALGWRDEPRELAKLPGVTRVLLLGDSFVFGTGVDDGERVSEALEREIGNLEAWNLGVTAYGPDQELRVLELFGPTYAPDLVIWFTCLANDVEDLRHEVRHHWPKPWYELAGSELVLHPPEPGILVRLRNASYLAELALSPLRDDALAHRIAAPWRDREAYDLYAAIVSRLAATSRMLGAPLLVAVIPSDENAATGAPTDARAIDALRSAGIDPLLLGPAFAMASSRGESLFLPDGHWSASGHALAAKTVAAGMGERGLLP